MSKYCPKCKHNFSDALDECVYCGSELKDGIIEIEDVKVRISKKFLDYQKQVVLLCGEYFHGKFINNGTAIIVKVNGRR